MGNWIQSSRMIRLALAIGLIGTLAVACGGDDDDDNGGGAGGGAGSSAGTGGSTAGTGGSTAGTGGSTAGTGGSTAGTGGSMAPVMCSGMMCSAVMSAQGMLPPCCDTDSGNACGATVGMAGECEAINQPGDLDLSCPDAMSVLGTPVPGCCKPDNKCGVRSMTLNGCVERTDYPPSFLMGGMALEAIDCGGDTDGGM